MSVLSVAPSAMAAASDNLANLGSALRNANAAAATQTTSIAAAAADEVSTAITALFGEHALEFQTLASQAATFHDEFVNLLNGGAAQYLNAEAANARQTLASVNPPAQARAAGAAYAAAAGDYFSIDTPFGPIRLTQMAVSGDPFANGPHTFSQGLISPVFSLWTQQNVTLSGGGTTRLYTGGTLNYSPLVPLLLSTLGPTVTGGASLADTVNVVSNALSSGNAQAAANALLSAPSKFSDAALFGHTTITVAPLQELGDPGSPNLQEHIPFGGLFASLQPLGQTFTGFTGVETAAGTPYTGQTVTILPSDITFQGTQFGGFFPVLFASLGLPS
jgi:PE family